MRSDHRPGGPRWPAVAGVAAAAALAFGSQPVLAAGGAPLFAGRTQDGVALRLRVVPDPASGVPVSRIGPMAARAISGRAREAGFRVLTRPRADGTLDVWVPVARTSAELRDLLSPAGVAVYDLHAALMTGPRPDPLLRLAERLGPATGGELYLTVPGSEGLNGPEPTRTALLGDLGGTDAAGRPLLTAFPRGFRVRHLPRRFRLVVGARGKKFRLLKATPPLRSADLSAPTRRRSTLTFTLSAAGRARWARLRAAGGRPALVLYAWEGQQFVAGDADPAAGAGRRLVVDVTEGSRARLLADMLRHVLPGRVIVRAEAATGTPRVRGGDPISPLPEVLRPWLLGPEAGLGAIDPASVLRPLTLTTAAGEWGIWTGIDLAGWPAATLVDPRFVALGPVSLGGFAGCELTPARPDLKVCGGGPGYVAGRVSARVARVTGGTASTVRNGWFLATGVRVTDTVPPAWRLAALDAHGRVIARSLGPD
ncbi:MAG: hypothetical protein IT200_08325 [Thermoleophilia bacterium]|nr:hypothetical protein [Thermoleophilia bacterium]